MLVRRAGAAVLLFALAGLYAAWKKGVLTKRGFTPWFTSNPFDLARSSAAT
jgi:hypothetical protein